MPPSSLVPEGDPSVLFTTAGMQQFKAYYTNPELSSSSRICTIQPSLRTSDIEEVGDATHLTLFEMLGFFSFGYKPGSEESDESATPYFKKVAIKQAYDFYFKELQFDIERANFTVYAGDEAKGVPKDIESFVLWKELGIPEEKIRYEGNDNFWGPTGEEGPCGPTTEVYIDGVEVGNVVFNQYFKSSDGRYTPLEYKGIDTGLGLERIAIISQGKTSVFETDLFAPIIELIKSLSKTEKYNDRSARIIADHAKAAIFLIADGVRPSNKSQGYILRRLIRRLVAHARIVDLSLDKMAAIIELIFNLYSRDYQQLNTEFGLIQLVIQAEIDKFSGTLEKGLAEYDKAKEKYGSSKEFPSELVFRWFDTYGFPVELTKELAEQDGFKVDQTAFAERFKKHQETSRAGADKVFKGGLADTKPQTIKHHTAHHLLLAALRQVLGDHVHQQGSNVTSERLRIDFSHPAKVTEEQLRDVEGIVNKAISGDLEVKSEEMPREEAEKLGALAEFGQKYGDVVSVYTILNKDGLVFSRELCGGPHVSRTGELGHFKILKEEASAAGIRRIKARVE